VALLPRRINYALYRIMPLPGVAIDPRKRPVVVDRRAGQGRSVVQDRKRKSDALMRAIR